ncbi:hypothetical protein ENUP19_0080G0026 [Entamoeba nuttalli]|uniref:Uncharacterized protein n=1 Tax=Entamoeba nuttalli TaxID=412467 RepID=A0ABQ0DF84_9EUKA
MNEVNDYDLNYVHSLEEAITELTEKVLELEDELKRIKNTVCLTTILGPVAQSVVHRTYRIEKCEGCGFDPRRDHFLFFLKK